MTRILAVFVCAALLVLGFAAVPVQGAVTCAYATSQRATTAPANVGNSVVFVYVVPQGATDDRLDVPKVCTDGGFRRSVIDTSYRNISTWMAKALAGTAGSRRFRTVVGSYRNPYTGTRRSMTRAFFIRSSTAASTWNCWSPSQKWTNLGRLLRSKGFSNPSHIHAVILQARQSCTSVGTAGAGALGGVGTPDAYGYALRFLWTGGSNHVRGKFGCANYSADAVLAHEILHVLGGVPYGAPASDNAGHVTSDHDVLEKVLDGPFADDAGRTWLRLDAGTADYRTTVLKQPFDVTGYSSRTSYRICS